MALPPTYTFLEGLFDGASLKMSSVEEALTSFSNHDIVLAIQVFSDDETAVEASIRLEGTLTGNHLKGFTVTTLAGKRVSVQTSLLEGRQGRILIATKAALSEIRGHADPDRVETLA